MGMFGIEKKDILIIILAFVAVLTFIPVFTYTYFAKDLSSPEAIMNRNNTGVVLLDRTGKPFFRFYQAQVRENIPLSSVPKAMQQAVIVAEDKSFYEHPGFSLRSMVGAMLADIKHGDLSYGGSTITQQLVKISLLNSQKSFLRKYQEIILANEIERRYSKDEILSMYLNSVYFGEGAFGIQSAARTYFDKDAKELDLAQAAMLAGVANAPSTLSPISGNPEKAKARQKYVLDEMVQQGYLTPDQKDQAFNEKLNYSKSPDTLTFEAPHFAFMVRDELIKKYGEEQVARSGFSVKTTLDLDYQRFAEKVVAEQVKNLAGNSVTNGAAVAMDPKTGEILAAVGSKDWNDDKFGKVNVVTSLRQPGSSFKPIVYAAALEQHLITPASVLQDVPTTFPGNYKPHDYDNKFRGPVLARRALANSLNVPAVEVMQKVGVPEAIEAAKRLGVTTLDDPSNYGLSLVLGAGEVKLLDMAGVYSVFANGGQKVEPTTILEIRDKDQNVVYSLNPKLTPVLNPGVAYQISSILSDNNARQEEFGNALTISRPAAVKTGTSENYRDSLTVGYTPGLTVAVWVGNNSGQTMDQVAGSLGAAPIWKAMVEKYLAGKPVEQFQKPDDIRAVPVCKNLGLKLREASASTGYTEYFLPGTEPQVYCSQTQNTAGQVKQDGSGKDKPISDVQIQDSTQYQTGGWYPVGPNGQALQYWNGAWYSTPQQDGQK